MEISTEQRERFEFTFNYPTNENMRRLTPVEFERFIYYLFERDGLYHPVLVGGPDDGGVDIELHSREVAPPRLSGLAQCKRLLTDAVTPIQLAQLIVAAQNAKADRRYCFATSRYTPAAYAYARNNEVNLFTCADIRFWVQDIRRRESLRSVAPMLPDMSNMPIPIICISNNKGGVGKTTITGNLAAALVAEHGDVLVIDADPQGDLTLWLSAQGRSQPQLSLYGVLVHEIPIRPLIQRTVESGVWILPSSRDMHEMPNTMNQWTLARRLAHALANLPLSDPPIRCILLDTPPALSTLTRSALLAATHLLLPLEYDMFSREGLVEFLGFVEQTEAMHQKRPVQILGGVATKVDMRFKWGFNYREKFNIGNHSRLLKSGLTEADFWCGVLRDRGDFQKAQGENKSVLQFARNSDAAKDVLKLAREVVRRVPTFAHADA
ncbi:MAG TPA: AAA family ATPase [Ktedonobacterales bacterium]|nr:AAA family ATPase [Ktedonobacterales bacterium]